MAFKRFLNETAFAKARTFRDYFINWQNVPGSIIHLRSNNTISFYFMGQKAFELGELGSNDEYAKVFQQEPVRGAGAEALTKLFKQARKAVTGDVEKNKKADLELARQSSLSWELLKHNKEFTLLDEQIQIPQDALADKEQERTRVDLLALEKSTRELVLLELKLSDDPDLDGAVLAQLQAVRAIPGALKGGQKIFLQHYQQVLAQKTELGMLKTNVTEIAGISGKNLVILGDACNARGRLACLEPGAIPENCACALLPAGAPLQGDLFLPLKEQAALALAGPRAAYMPRKERANDFTRLADSEQAQWAAIKPKQPPLGSYEALLTEYFKNHGLNWHTRVKNPRGSRTACAQVFAPVLAANPTAHAGLLHAFNERISPSWGVKVGSITECHFEVPHNFLPNEPKENIFPKADVQVLTGEAGRPRTSLDAALAVTGTRDGREVRALIGIEFRYAEAEFAPCSGFTSEGFVESGRQACLSGKDRGSLCYLRNYEKLSAFEKENMNEIFSAPNPLDEPGGACLLIGPVNQLYRNHFATLKLKELFKFDEALFLVVYDSRNQSLVAPERPSPENHPVQGPLERYREKLSDKYRPTFAQLPVQSIIEGYSSVIVKKSPPWLTKIKERYHW